MKHRSSRVIRHRWRGPRHKRRDPFLRARLLGMCMSSVLFGILVAGGEMIAYAHSDRGYMDMSRIDPEITMINPWHVGIAGFILACLAPLVMLMTGVGIREREEAHV